MDQEHESHAIFRVILSCHQSALRFRWYWQYRPLWHPQQLPCHLTQIQIMRRANFKATMPAKIINLPLWFIKILLAGKLIFWLVNFKNCLPDWLVNVDSFPHPWSQHRTYQYWKKYYLTKSYWNIKLWLISLKRWSSQQRFKDKFDEIWNNERYRTQCQLKWHDINVILQIVV